MVVAGHLRGGEDRHVVAAGRGREQRRRLGGGEQLGWALRVGAVHPQPGRARAPGLDPALRVGQIDEVLATEEVLPHVGHHPLHPRLVARAAHPGRVGVKPAGLRVVQPAQGERRVHRLRVGDHRGQVVRDQHPEHPAEPAPRRLAPGDHRRQGLRERQPHEHVPRIDRSEDQRVRDPPPPRVRIRDQPEPAEVQLTLHPRLTIGDPHRGLTAAEPAPGDCEPVQRPIRHRHPVPRQLAVDVGQLQVIALDPLPDPRLLGQQRLPRRAVPAGPHRADRGHHRPEQLVGQLVFAALADQARGHRRLDVPARGLAIHPRPLTGRTQPLTAQPTAQHFPNLDHRHLPERHPTPPDLSTWTNRKRSPNVPAPDTPVVP